MTVDISLVNGKKPHSTKIISFTLFVYMKGFGIFLGLPITYLTDIDT